jgi:hypothetical protein
MKESPSEPNQPSPPDQEPEELKDVEPGTEVPHPMGNMLQGQGILKDRDPSSASFTDPLEGSVLKELIEEPLAPPDSDQMGKLRPETRTVLFAARILNVLGMSSNTYRELREDLQAARASIRRWKESHAKVADPLPETLEELLKDWADKCGQEGQEFEHVDRMIAIHENLAHTMERAIEKTGYRWDWDTGRIDSPSGEKGGRPRQLLRDLVRAILLHYGFTNNTIEVRQKIASDLAPFFSANLVDTSKGSPLYNAVDHSLAAP